MVLEEKEIVIIFENVEPEKISHGFVYSHERDLTSPVRSYHLDQMQLERTTGRSEKRGLVQKDDAGLDKSAISHRSITQPL